MLSRFRRRRIARRPLPGEPDWEPDGLSLGGSSARFLPMALAGIVSCVALGATGVGAGASTQAAATEHFSTQRQGFKTPSGNIACVIRGISPVSGDPGSLDCYVRKDGAVWSLPAYFGPIKRFKAKVSAAGLPVLRYGGSWQFVVKCTLRRSGLTCRNWKNGFFLSDTVQRVF